jgi:hypothetical protein
MHVHHSKLYIPVLVAAIIFISNCAYGQKITTTEKFICAFNKQEMVDPSVSVSNDLRRIGFRVKQGRQQVAVVDGVRGKAYDSVGLPQFSPDSKRYAYLARNGASWFIILNGNQQEAAGSGVHGLQFLPDNKNIMYVVKDGNREHVIMNTLKGNIYDKVDENSFRFRSGHFAYIAWKGNKQLMILDGVEGTPYDRVGTPVFSNKDGHLGYTAKKNGAEFAVIDNKEGMPYDSVEAVIFSNNGQQYAYHVVHKGNEFVVTNGKEGNKYLFVHSLLVSGDGSKVIYGIETTNKNSEGFFHNVVVNDEVMSTYETVVESSLRLSNDNKHLAYEAEWHDEFFVVLDGKNGKHYGDVVQSTIVFSPNGKRIAYAGENETRRRVSIDEVEGEGYDDIYSITFTRNSKRVVYVAKQGNKEFVVVDTMKGNEYDTILGQGGLVLDSSKKLHYLAVKDGKVFLVEEKIK